MSLHSLLGLPSTVNGETLPEYMNRTTRLAKPKPDVVETALAEHRDGDHAERQLQAAYDKAAMLDRIRARRIQKANKHLDAAEAALIGDHQ